jgi:hypothetical protein
MPLITCNLAKGIAPRLHEPKPKAKSHTKMDGSKAQPTPKNCKRVATSDEESEEEAGSDSQLSDDEAMKPKKKESKRQHVQESDSEVEVEIIDQNNEPSEKEIKEVDTGVKEQGPTNEHDISTNLNNLMSFADAHMF